MKILRLKFLLAFILTFIMLPDGVAAARQGFSKLIYMDSMYKQAPGPPPSGSLVPDPQSTQIQVYIYKKSTVLWPQTMAGLPQLAPGVRPSSGQSLVKDPQLVKLIQKYAKQHGVDPRLVQAMIRQESGFNPIAVSPKGAMGLMQLMPETAAALGVEDPFDLEQNLRGGIRFLKLCLNRFDQNLPLALAAYNAGPGRVVEYKGMPPFKETHTYVKKIVLDYCGQTVDPAQIKLGQAAETKVAQDQPDEAAKSPAQPPATPPINLSFYITPSLERVEALTAQEKTGLKKSAQMSIY
jgi:hypothetical protein